MQRRWPRRACSSNLPRIHAPMATSPACSANTSAKKKSFPLRKLCTGFRDCPLQTSGSITADLSRKACLQTLWFSIRKLSPTVLPSSSLTNIPSASDTFSSTAFRFSKTACTPAANPAAPSGVQERPSRVLFQDCTGIRWIRPLQLFCESRPNAHSTDATNKGPLATPHYYRVFDCSLVPQGGQPSGQRQSGLVSFGAGDKKELGAVQHQKRLGGLLKYYEREAA